MVLLKPVLSDPVSITATFLFPNCDTLHVSQESLSPQSPSECWGLHRTLYVIAAGLEK